jgi:glutamine cyclotransferase
VFTVRLESKFDNCGKYAGIACSDKHLFVSYGSGWLAALDINDFSLVSKLKINSFDHEISDMCHINCERNELYIGLGSKE